MNPFGRSLRDNHRPCATHRGQPRGWGSPRYAGAVLHVGILREGSWAFTCPADRSELSVDSAERIAESSGCLIARFPADEPAVFLMMSHHCGGGTEHSIFTATCARISAENGSARSLSARGRPGRPSVGRTRRSRANPLVPRNHPTTGQRFKRTCSKKSWPVHAHVHHTLGVPELLIEQLTELGHLIRLDNPRLLYRLSSNQPGPARDQSYCGEPDESECNAA